MQQSKFKTGGEGYQLVDTKNHNVMVVTSMYSINKDIWDLEGVYTNPILMSLNDLQTNPITRQYE